MLLCLFIYLCTILQLNLRKHCEVFSFNIYAYFRLPTPEENNIYVLDGIEESALRGQLRA